MTVYPFAIDSDADIIRVDDNITEIGGEAINQLRDAVFAIEKELGIRPSGSAGSIASRFDVAHNADGSIKASALLSVGLATLPISDSQVGTNAGIKEFKLALDHSTSDLYTLIITNQVLLNSLTTFAQNTDSDLSTHVGGGAILTDGSPGRHVASHIDLNDIPTDTRDPLFTWAGLLDKDGNLRSATTVAEGLDQINSALTTHENTATNAHIADAIDLDVSNFESIPQDKNTVQKFVDFVDDFDVITVRQHRATQHANAIPKIARSTGLSLPDGYGWQNVVAPTTCSTFLVRPPNTMPVDDISSGDDIVSFIPDNANFLFDAQFVRVKVGDIIRINYGNGMEAAYPINSIRFIPGSEWIVRLNGVNLTDADGYALARIDRPLADRETAGVLAVAAANATPTGSFDSILQSVIVGHPKGAVAVGNGFDPGQLDATHYKLYMELYPTGNPSDRVITLPFIDVTGNAGATVGKYTLDSVIQSTNKNLREIGYNYRLIAFNHDGDFAIMMADAINGASFSITSGSNSAGTLVEGAFTENVIGDGAGDGFDALGLGQAHADVASPAFISSFVDSSAALLPTKVIVPRKNRNYIVDGVKSDSFGPTWLANQDGYWDGYVSARIPISAFTVETTYTVELDLRPAGLKPGMTLVVQPTVDFADSLYNDLDYGRFIIKSVSFAGVCPGEPALTLITVINGIHALGTGFSASAEPPLPVRLYFGEDSVSFNNQNVIDSTLAAIDYLRLHEIFISNQRRTFSHERARMPLQAEATPALATTNWHIENVSPKLRGYRDTITDFARFIRFYILSYDSSTGEYDGYIGQRSPSSNNISKVGPITRGRKNVPTRFYDETNVDFIDLVFVESSASSPGSPVLSDGVSGGGGTPRFVDIELFESLQLDDEMMLLATAEVNWDPASNQDVVQRVRNRREFGSIDEEDFTDSAVDFITSGDRFLHDNGVLRGLEFDFINATDNREIFYKGGVALVNGKVITLNAVSVTIPELLLASDTVPTTVDWAVCVNEGGHLEPIIVTATKTQFFAEDNVSLNTYYVPSVTFLELVETRKDLTPIAVVTANIASTTINESDHFDVRRFIDDGKARELVYSPADFAGTFHTAAALKNWVNRYGSSNPLIVKVRGTFDISTSVDLTGFTTQVILEGDGAVFNVTANRGFLVDANLTLRNITFNYNPSSPPTFITDDKINSNNGCIYQGSGTNIQNVTIENCTFVSSVTTQRPPFISFEREGTDVVDELNILNNKFRDANVDPAEDQAAIAIISLNTTGTTPALVINSNITGNICNNHQGIYMTVETDSSTEVVSPGLSAVNVNIAKNNCGIIGFLTTAKESAYALDTRTDRQQGLNIENNAANIIANVVNITIAVTKGTQLASHPLGVAVIISTGPVSIINNSCHWIHVSNGQSLAANEFGQMIISGNKLSAYNTTFLEQWNPLAAGPVSNTAIYHHRIVTTGFGDSQDQTDEAIITDNMTVTGLFDATAYFYAGGIRTDQSAVIKGNTIRGLAATTGIGINVDVVGINPTNLVTVQNNKIYREGRSIARYIFLDSASQVGGVVTDNFFDDFTIDGSDDETINGTGSSPTGSFGSGWVIERNRNQTVAVVMAPADGTYKVQDATAGGFGGLGLSTITSYVDIGTESVFSSGTGTIFFLEDQNTNLEFQWTIPARTCLPDWVQIISCSIFVDSTNPDVQDLARLIIADLTTFVEETSGDSDPALGVTLSHTLSGTFINTPTSRININLLWRARKSGAGTEFLNVSAYTIVYRW